MRCCALLALIASVASAAPLRLLVAYGHNGGDGPRAPLRYAENDATRFAKVMRTVGAVEPDDVKVLTGKPLAELYTALDWARARARTNPETLLIVYVSSHADAKRGLLPGKEALAWSALRERIAATGAKARVTIVDACQSAGIIESAARLAPNFVIQAEDQLTVKGDAFITSSASTEPSLEAGMYRGSVFTQHLVAGLSGAAELSGDGRVSLDEAYRYAFERTTEGQSGQHPAYALQLSGYGDIMLSVVDDSRGGLRIPKGLDELVVRDPVSHELLLLARKPLSTLLFVPPGDWAIELTRQGQTRSGTVRVLAGQPVSIDEGALTRRSRTSSLVQLGGQRRPECLQVQIDVPRPDPLLNDVRDELTRALASVCGTANGARVTLARDHGQLVISWDLGTGPARDTAPPEDRRALVTRVVKAISTHRTLE